MFNKCKMQRSNKTKNEVLLNFLCLFSSFLILNPTVHGQSQQEENLDEQGFYELEELINTTVTVGSKQREKASKTPAIVSVFTADDIANSGYDNLYDLLATVPGVEVIESYYGQTNLLFRGVQQEHFNNKSLILLDGHRIYEQTYGNFHLEQIPLNAIERIEIIRGPGSALYGTNAYTGLVNITTKKDFKTNELVIKNRIGLFQDREDDEEIKTSTFSMISFRKQLATDMSFNSYNSARWHQPFIYSIEATENRASPPTSRPVSKEYHDHYINTYNSFKWQDLDINLFFFYKDKSKLGTSAGGHFIGSQEHDDNPYWNLGGNISYLHQFSEQFGIRYKVFADYYDAKIEVGSTTNGLGVAHLDAFYNGYKLIGEVEADMNFSKTYSSILGVYAEYNKTSPFTAESVGEGADISNILEPFDEPHDSYDLAVYLQGKANYDVLSITGGLRYNFNKNYEHSFAPRGGINITLYEGGEHGVYLKGLYGFAIRNPSFFEKFSDSDIVKGKEDLNPESIHSVDAAVEYVLTNALALRTNYFFNSSNDFIERSSDAPPQYINGEGQEIQGIEVDLKYYPIPGYYRQSFWITTNLSWRTGEEKDTGDDINYLTPLLFNLRLDVAPANYHFGLVFKYIDDRTGILVDDNESVCPGCRNTVKSYWIINLLLKWKFTERHEIEFGVHNIFDEDFSYPEIVRNKVRSVDGVTPFYSGRYFYFAGQFAFGL